MPTVLVVDDAPIDRELATGLLRRNPELTIESVESANLAMQRLEAAPPVDLVVTDLTMPEMNGLELVTAVRVRFPQVPVILITANGSETLAIAALEQGATSYVPKSQLASRLVDTVDNVLIHARAQLDTERLMQSLSFAHLRFELAQAEVTLDQLVALVQRLVASIWKCDAGDEIRLGLTLEEVLRDVMLRGNLGLTSEEVHAYQSNQPDARRLVAKRLQTTPFCDRRLCVDVNVTCDEARFLIEHQGEPNALPSNETLRSPQLLERPECRAYVLLQSFVEEFEVDRSGRCLTLVKRR